MARRIRKLYKIVLPDGSACHGGNGQWSLPKRGKSGAWMPKLSNIEPCARGYHVLAVKHVTQWLKEDCALYECEADPKAEYIDHGDKIVVGRARLTRLIGVMTDAKLRAFACDCAEHVLPIFEKSFPKDDRPRRAIEATRAWLKDPTAARAAARAAAGAAARAAAWATAWDAAGAAAGAAEREWQCKALITILKG